MYQNKCFLTVVVVVGSVLTHPSVAVPTVKKLGNSANNSAYNIQNNKTTQTKSLSTGQRNPSVRILGPSVKTTTKPISNATVIKNQTLASGTSDSARWSGLHGNLIKGIGSKISQNYTPQTTGIGTSDLAQRINALEEQMTTKQTVLEPGDGITIDGNTIAVSEEITALPEKVATINQEIDNLSEKVDVANLSSNYYTIGQTQDYLQQNYYTKQYVDQIVSQLSGASIVNTFDPGFLQ